MRAARRLAAAALAASLLASLIEATDAGPTRIRVDFSRVRRTIPALLFGQNLQTIERGEGIVRPDGSFDQAILDKLSEVRVTSLRYPGGTAADYFHWWQALGPRSRRPPQSTGYLDEYYSPVVGPDEFLKLAIALRAVPYVTANSGSGSAEEAAALARFFEARGLPVIFWEIGNEIYFEGIGENGLVGLPPDVYARKVIEYASAIRKEAPYAKIQAAAVIGPEEQDSFWNAVVLGLAGPYVDGISVHNAYFPLYGYLPSGQVPSDEYLYRAMLGATAAVEASMSVLEAQLERLGKLIPIFVTEYDGIFYPDETKEDVATTYRRNPTLACALFNASVLHVFLRHERVQAAHHMSLAGDRFGSLIGVDPASGAVFPNPQFYVHREYAREAGRLLVEVAVEPGSSVFSSGPTKLLSGQTDVPMLDAIATRDPSDRAFALFVVNRSLDTAVTASVTLQLPPDAQGTVSILTGPSYDARNDSQSPDRVSLRTAAFGQTGSYSHTFPPHSVTIFRWAR